MSDYKINNSSIPRGSKCQCTHSIDVHGSDGKICAACDCREFRFAQVRLYLSSDAPWAIDTGDGSAKHLIKTVELYMVCGNCTDPETPVIFDNASFRVVGLSAVIFSTQYPKV